MRAGHNGERRDRGQEHPRSTRHTERRSRCSRANGLNTTVSRWSENAWLRSRHCPICWRVADNTDRRANGTVP